MIKVFFLDFYGTVVHEDGEIIKKITQIIYDTGEVENMSEIDAFWWNDFQNILISCSFVLGRYGKEEAHAKKFIYSDDEAPQCPGKNLLYFKPKEAGKSVCGI